MLPIWGEGATGASLIAFDVLSLCELSLHLKIKENDGVGLCAVEFMAGNFGNLINYRLVN